MKYRIWLAFLFISGIIYTTNAGNLNKSIKKPTGEILVIQNVNIIDMDNGVVVKKSDILISENKILKVGQNLEVPESAQTLNLDGRYVIPALFDMHTHISTENPWHEYHLALYRYFGIHAVNVTAGSDELKKLKTNNEKGVRKFILPEIYLASELIDGDPPLWGDDHNGPILTDTEVVEPTLLNLKEKGYKDIKIYNQLQEDVYLKMLETAEKLDLRVIGHVPYSLSLAKRLDFRHQRIDHLDGYLEVAYEGNQDVLQTPGIQRPKLLADGFDEDKMIEAAQRTAKRGIWNSPTHVLFSSLTDSTYVDEVMNGEISKWLDPTLQKHWRGVVENENSMPHLRSEKYRDIHRNMISILHNSGAKLLAGTDAPQPVLLYGHSLHKELQYFVEAGLTPYEALKTATVNPAEFLGLDDQGKIKKGYLAEMVILKENPLTDIQNTLSIEGYVSANNYMDKQKMKELLISIKEKIN